MQFDRQPFQSQVDTAFFFPDGSRREIVDEIKSALAEGVALLTLTGTEGSGKSMICRMVEQELEGNFLLLFLDQSVESFDDVVDLVAESIGLITEEVDSKTRMIRVADALREEPKRLVIILDGAEKMYLATLERIRRMLDEVNEKRVVLQILFSGRPLFSVSFKKLHIISFREIQEKHISLDPLDGAATHGYLNHCIDIAAGKKLDFFTPDVAEKIARDGRGNFSLINQLAAGYLDTGGVTAGADFKVPDYLVGEPGPADFKDLRSRVLTRLNSVDLDFLKVPRFRVRYWLPGVLILVVALLIFLYSGKSAKDLEEVPETAPVPVLELDKVESLEMPTPLKEPENQTADKKQSPAVKKVEHQAQQATGQEIVASAVEPRQEQPKVPEIPKAAENKQVEPMLKKAAEPPQNPEPPEKTEPPKLTEPRRPAPSVQEQVQPALQPTTSSLPRAGPVAEAGVADQPPVVEKPAEQSIKKAEPPQEERVAEAEKPQVRETIVAEQKKQKRAPEAPEVPEVPVVVTLEGTGKKLLPVDIVAASQPAESLVPAVSTEKEKVAEKPPGQRASGEASAAKPVEQQAEARPVEQTTIELKPLPQQSPAPVAATQSPQTRTTSDEDIDVGQFYTERLAAGARWLVGGGKGKYTVQLMVLRSDEAERNLKQMLVEDGYKNSREQLYILRRMGLPQTVMLFYGEFDTLAQADQAGGNLPVSVRSLNPFALSIKEAVEKAKSGK